MKILIVNTSDIYGGAARAAYRLHRSLLMADVDSQMLVQSKLSDDYTVLGPKSKVQKGLPKLRPKLDSLPVRFYKARSKTFFSPAWLPFSGMSESINALKPDLVHLHWICGGMMRIEVIAKIKAPIVWSLHDNWAFTGGCHVKWECGKYKDKCGCCPRLGSDRENDLSRKVWNRKNKVFSKLPNMIIVGLSGWMTNCAKESSLFRDNRVVNIPNPIDSDNYKPFHKKEARELLSLPHDKKLILFGAINAPNDINKGFKYLSQALSILDCDDVEMLVFGSSQPKEPQCFRHKAHYLGQLHDDVSLRVLYCAADVMVVPSLQENLSNAIMESLACGTPVVGFQVGGNPDMIDHKINGYLAKPFAPEDLARGIEWVLEEIDRSKNSNLNQEQNADFSFLSEIGRKAREKVMREFDSKVVAKRYLDLYETFLSVSP